MPLPSTVYPASFRRLTSSENAPKVSWTDQLGQSVTINRKSSPCMLGSKLIGCHQFAALASETAIGHFWERNNRCNTHQSRSSTSHPRNALHCFGIPNSEDTNSGNHSISHHYPSKSVVVAGLPGRSNVHIGSEMFANHYNVQRRVQRRVPGANRQIDAAASNGYLTAGRGCDRLGLRKSQGSTCELHLCV